MFRQKFRPRSTNGVYSTRRSWNLRPQKLSNPTYNPDLLQPGVVVHVSNGELMPPPTSHLLANWRFKNFYGRITECTPNSARVTKPNGLNVLLNSALSVIRIVKGDELAQVQQKHPDL